LPEVFHIISEDTRQIAESPVERVLREGVVVGLANHTALLAKDGVERPIADSAAPIRDASGKVAGVVLVFHDMTVERAVERKLRQSEQRFRRLFESGVLGIIVADLVGNIRDANDAFLSLFGYTNDDLRAGHVRWSEMTPPKWQARDAEAVKELGATGVLRSYEKEYFHKDGTVVPIVLGAAMIEGSDECICYVLDLTERKRAESAVLALNMELELRVEQRTEQLRQLNRELESFSYSVAHDLRAPLRGIAGFAEVLADDYADKFDAEGLDCVAEIRSNASRMAQLIDALLSLSRVNRTDLHPVNVDLGVLAREVADELERLNPRPALELVVGDDLEVVIDPLLARTVVENLVGNAWKFTRDVAAPRIEVGSTREDGAIVVFVRDNGVGFDMKYVEKLFSPFQRLHTSTEFPGTGIGLANIQRIIKRHGGKVWAESADGMGATFFLQLPGTTEKT
ncbi:MAG: PAS domain S-box protein, partial [Deltaproteobacteria bacterium]|nr:PAS domain S-box protein [Deltaproteobacteria bacterium]